MICPSCQHDNIEGADECANCGQSLYGLDLPEAGNKAASPSFIKAPLEGLSQRDVPRVSVSDPVALAVRQMQRGGTAAVLVMDGQRLAGIITSRDIVLKVAGPTEDLNAVTCSQIMTPDPVVFRPEDSIVLAINKMSSGEFRHIPIVREDSAVSIVDVNDVFRFITPYLV